MNRNLRTRTRLLLAVPAIIVAASLTACSGAGAAQRPSTDELSDGLSTIFEEAGQGELFTDDQLDCVADEFLASDVSDQDLANLADGKDVQTCQDAKTLVTETMQNAVTTCAS